MEDSRFGNRPVNPLDERKQQGSKKSFLGSIYGRMALILHNGTTDKAALSESDGKLITSLYGKAGSTGTAISVETSGEQKVVNYGKQTGDTIGAFNLNANNVLRVELINGATIQVDPLLVPVAEGLLWNPGTTSASIYKVKFELVNFTASDVTGINIGQDIGAGGSLATFEYWRFGLIVPASGSSGWQGPFTMDGADRVRGVAGTVDSIGIHWDIKQVF